jgi:chitinase
VAAVPGVSQSVTVGATVNLDGSGSQARTYVWAMTDLPHGSACRLTNPYTATPSFVADVAGNYVLVLATDAGSFNSVGVLAVPA